MMEKETKIKLKKSTRKNLKWAVISVTSVTTLLGIFTGKLFLFTIPALSFWVYVILDKFNPLVKNSDMNKIIKKEKKPKTKKIKVIKNHETNIYDDSHESGY